MVFIIISCDITVMITLYFILRLFSGVWFCSWLKVTMTHRKGTAKLKELLEIERQVQQQWQEQHVFEIDAPEPGSQAAQ